jgi:hypothetical protein
LNACFEAIRGQILPQPTMIPAGHGLYGDPSLPHSK